ncbi:MAG: zinc-ribbon domain-containing protein [Mycobacterium sp.]|nr:zinc-ribbon domain-containing protein [Mycobacterium sp.]
MPVFNPQGRPYAGPGSQSPASSVEQTGPPLVGAADHPPATFDSSTERADRAGGNGQTLTEDTSKATTATILYCPNCGTPHHENERFCPQCGHRIIS